MQTTSPTTLWQALQAPAKLRGSAPALRFEGQQTSFAQITEQSRAMAAALQSSGIQHGDRVAWIGFNHPLHIALLFACAGLGAIAMPLNYRLAAPELERIMQDASPSLLVHDAVWGHVARGLQTRCGASLHGFEGLLDAGLKLSAFDMNAGHAEDAVLLVYTSGTTGLPRGALHTQRNLCANMAIAGKNAALSATDSIATMLPLFHVGGLCIQTLPALAMGACVILHAKFDPGAALICFAKDKPTLTLQVPATMRALIDHPDWAQTDLSSLRAVWAGSSVLPANLIEAFHVRGIPVCNVYGSTETGPFSISLPPAHARTQVGSCGWPSGDEVEVKLLDVQQGVGQICIRAPNVAECYWPDLPLKDAEGWFYTGDLARQETNGSYWVVGRAKDMLISGGENIYPAEIENLLAAQRGVMECAVIGVPDARWGEVVAACVLLAADADPTLMQEQLKQALSSQLARYKLPRQWHFLSALPKTALGKVQKVHLLAMLASPQET